MMLPIKIASRNVVAHSWSSVVLFSIFFLITLVLFWVFGFVNTIRVGIVEFYRGLYGDIYLCVDYQQKTKLRECLAPLSAKEMLLEDVPVAVFDFNNKSAVEFLRSFDGANDRKLKYLKVTKGRLPEADDEILVPESFLGTGEWSGQMLYATITTPGKVLNTAKYKIVGASKIYFFVPTGGVTDISATTEMANSVKLFLGDSVPSRQNVNAAYNEAKRLLADSGVMVKEDSFDIYKQIDRLNLFTVVFQGVEVLLMLVIFPLAGSVLGAMVWMAAYKRRKEIWTYLAIGWRQRNLRTLFSFEFWLITLAGLVAGTGAGYLLSMVSANANIWLDFGNLFSCPLVATVGVVDVAIYSGFLFLCAWFWMVPPLRKIVGDKLFSY